MSRRHGRGGPYLRSSGVPETDILREALLDGRAILFMHSSGADRRTLEFLMDVRRAGRHPDLSHVDFVPGTRPLPGLESLRPSLPDAEEWSSVPCPDSKAKALGTKGMRLAEPLGRPLPNRKRTWLAKDGGQAGDDLPDPAPEIDAASFVAGTGIVVASLPPRNVAGSIRWLSWLALSAIQAAERDGRRPPVVVADSESSPGPFDVLRILRGGLAWRVAAGPEGLVVALPPGEPETGFPGLPERWSDTVAADRAGMRDDGRAGLHAVERDGLKVRAIRLGCLAGYDHRHPDREWILLVTVDSRGILRGWTCVREEPLPDSVLAHVVREACVLRVFPPRPGMSAADPAHAPRLDFRRHDAPLPLARHGMIPSPASAALCDLLADDLGPERWGIVSVPNRAGIAPDLQEWAMQGPERRQFLAAYPSFARAALDPEVTRLVDARQPVLDRLSELMGAPPCIVRRFASRADAYFPMATEADWVRTGLLLGRIGHGALPADDDENGWFRLFLTFDRLRPLLGNLSLDQDDMAAMAMRLPGRTWPERCEAVSWLDAEARRLIADCLVRGLSPWLRLATGDRDPSAILAHIARAYGTPARMMAAARAWHDDPLLSNGFGDMPPDARWPVPFDRIALPGGEAVALGSMADLVAEGSRGPDGLSHCVANYGMRCATGDSLVVSFRAVGGRRLSTLELVPDPEGRASDDDRWLIGGRPFRVSQHQGNANGPPPPPANAMRAVLRAVLSDGHPVDASAFGRRPPVAPVAREGVDVAGLYLSWRRILPRSWRHPDVASFVTACRATQVRGA